MLMDIKNGSNVRLTEIHQKQTYGGLMAGLPNDSLNKAIIKRCLEEASDMVKGYIAVKLIEPVVKEVAVSLMADEKISYPCLPGYITTLVLDDMEDKAVVVLFTNSIVDASEIAEAIKKLDWQEICG